MSYTINFSISPFGVCLLHAAFLILCGCTQGTIEKEGAPGPHFFEPFRNEMIRDFEEGSGGNLLAVGDNGAIQHSDDNGISWTPVKSGVPNNLYGVAVHQKTSTAVAVGHDGAIVRSTDGGKTWVAVHSGTDATLVGVVIHQETGTFIAYGILGTVLRSEDRGQTWVASSTGTGEDLERISGAASSRTLIAVTESGTLLRSENLGERWEHVLRSPGAYRAVLSSGQDAAVALWERRLYRSTNEGRTWSAIPRILAEEKDEDEEEDELGQVECVATVPRTSSVFVSHNAKLARSTDHGATWSEVALGFGPVACIGANQATGTLVAVGINGEIARSMDNGQNWTYHMLAWGDSLATVFIQYDPQSRAFMVAYGDKIAIGASDGTDWRVSAGQVPSYGLYVNATGNGIINVTDYGLFAYERSGEWRHVVETSSSKLLHGPDRGVYYLWRAPELLASRDDGRTWARHDTKDSADVLSHEATRSLFALRQDVIVQSKDHGRTWQDVHKFDGLSLDMLITLRNGNVAALSSSKMLTLRKGKEGYTATLNEQDKDLPEFQSVHTLQSGALVVTGGRGEIYRSNDNGKSWTERGALLDSAWIETLRIDRDTVLAINYDNAIFHSTDGGRTFGEQKFEAYDIQRLAFNPKTGTALAAGGKSDGIGRSSDRGATWSVCDCRSLAEEQVYVTGVRFHEATGAFVVVGWGAVQEANAWRSTDDGVSWTRANESDEALRALEITAEGKLVAVGRGAVTSGDGGLTWERVLGTNYNLNDLGYHRDTGVLLGVGDNGFVVRSTDSGKTWSTSRSGTEEDLDHVTWAHACDCFLAVGANGTVIRSDNHGQAWTLIQGVARDRDFENVGESLTGDVLFVIPKYTSDAATRLISAVPYPYITAVEYSGLGDGNVRLDVSVSDDTMCEGACVQLLGLSNADFERSRPFRSGLPQGKRVDESRWRFQLDPRTELSAIEGEKVHFAFELSGERFHWRQPAGERAFSFEYAADPTIRNLTLSVAAYICFALVLYVLFPGVLMRVARNFGKLEAIGGLHPSLDVVVAIVSRVTVLPWLASQPRALDHWIAEHGKMLTATLEHKARMVAQDEFFPLPVRLASTKETVLPSAQTFASSISGRKRILNLVGAGGTGKTTLARQLARWAASGTVFPFVSIAIWVDDEIEDPSSYLLHYVRMAAADSALPDAFIHALFRHRRLLPILDRLSERSAATQERWQSHFPHFVSSCVVTSRSEFATDFARSEIAELSPLDASNLTGLLDHLVRKEGLQIDGLAERAELLSKLSRALRVGRAEMKVTPLLARLFVKAAVSGNASAQVMELAHLPASIPEIFFRYITLLNPSDATASNFLSTHEMYQVARLVAAVEIAATFAPRSVRVTDVQRELERALPALYKRGCDPIRRLLDNQVLHVRDSLGEEWLRFELDPVAEYIAAAELADRCGQDVAAWTDLIRKLDEPRELARGFRAAIYVTYTTYCSERGWPPEAQKGLAELVMESDSVRS